MAKKTVKLTRFLEDMEMGIYYGYLDGSWLPPLCTGNILPSIRIHEKNGT